VRWPTAVYFVSWSRESTRNTRMVLAETFQTCCGCTDDDGFIWFHDVSCRKNIKKTHVFPVLPAVVVMMRQRGAWSKIQKMLPYACVECGVSTTLQGMVQPRPLSMWQYIHNPIYSSVRPICIDLIYTVIISSIFLMVASPSKSKHIATD
jgi:hypothetical protein